MSSGKQTELAVVTNSKFVPILEVLLTNMLGKVVNPACNLLTFRMAASGEGGENGLAIIFNWIRIVPERMQ